MSVRTAREDGVLRITLDRPEARNAFDAGLIAGLAAALADVGDARCVVLDGAGPSFCAGADLRWMAASVDLDEAENRADAERMAAMFRLLGDCPAPTVAIVHGHAIGGGAGLVAACDIAIAHPRTAFAFSEARLGLIPAVISPWVLRRVGHAARRWFLTAARFGAAEALRIGLVDAVEDDPATAAAAVVRDVLAGGPRAVREAKRLVAEPGDDADLAARIAAVRASPEGQEGLAAFLERREPAWRSGAS